MNTIPVPAVVISALRCADGGALRCFAPGRARREDLEEVTLVASLALTLARPRSVRRACPGHPTQTHGLDRDDSPVSAPATLPAAGGPLWVAGTKSSTVR